MSHNVYRVRARGMAGESYPDALRRLELFGVMPTDTDEEAVGKPAAVAEAASLDAQAARDAVADLVLPQNKVVGGTLAAAEALFTAGTKFAWVHDGLIEVRERTSGGSTFLLSQPTAAALASPNGTSLVGFRGSGVGEVLTNAAALLDVELDIRRFGARFNVGDVSDIALAWDDTDAWENALAALAALGGGTLKLPRGASKTTRVLTIPVNVPIRIIGTGTRKVYPGAYVAGQKSPSLIVPYHSGRSAFRFLASVNGQGAFSGETFNVATLEGAVQPDAAFGWETQGAFLYGFTFRAVGIHGFRKDGSGSAFDAYNVGGSQLAVGAVLIEDCVINRNNWIARCVGGTSFNSFRFIRNKAGQNGYLENTGGLDISGHNITINENILEGQRNPVKTRGGYRETTVCGNYFEANVGIACIDIGEAFSFNVGPNFYGALNPANIEHKVVLRYTGLGSCLDPYWPIGVNKMAPALIGTSAESSLNNASNYVYQRFDRFDGANYGSRPNALAQLATRVTNPVRDINPQTGKAIPVQEYTTTGTGIISMTQTIAGAVGQWAVVCIPFKRIADAGAAVNPYLGLNINNNGGVGSADFPGSNFMRWWRDGEWIMVTAATKIGEAMTTLGVNFYPFGISPAAGRVARFLRPYTYILDDINKAIPFMDGYIAESVVAAPTTGTWVAGDNIQRTAGGFFSCTASGSPGTWTP